MNGKTTLASKLAQQATATAEARASMNDIKDVLPDVGAVEAPVNQAEAGSMDGAIKVGTVAFGEGMQHKGNMQGRARTDRRMPGYYSINIGRIYLKGRVIDWPLHSPLVPEEDDTALIEYLEHQVKNKRAELVKAPATEE
jgi:hypothetical protein